MTFNPTKNRFAIHFILRFVSAYFIGLCLYSLFALYHSSDHSLDPFTTTVVKHTGALLSLFDMEISFSWNDSRPNETKPSYHSIYVDNCYAISIAGGCNGLNLLLLFTAFVFAFKSNLNRQAFFLGLGLPLIHLANLFRLGGLSYLNTHGQREHFYFYHKYAFTLLLYALVIALWIMYLKTSFYSKQQGSW